MKTGTTMHPYLIVIVGVLICVMVGSCQGKCACHPITNCKDCVKQKIPPRKTGATTCVFVKSATGDIKCKGFEYDIPGVTVARTDAECSKFDTCTEGPCMCTPITVCEDCVVKEHTSTPKQTCVFADQKCLAISPPGATEVITEKAKCSGGPVVPPPVVPPPVVPPPVVPPPPPGPVPSPTCDADCELCKAETDCANCIGKTGLSGGKKCAFIKAQPGSPALPPDAQCKLSDYQPDPTKEIMITTAADCKGCEEATSCTDCFDPTKVGTATCAFRQAATGDKCSSDMADKPGERLVKMEGECGCAEKTDCATCIVEALDAAATPPTKCRFDDTIQRCTSDQDPATTKDTC